MRPNKDPWQVGVQMIYLLILLVLYFRIPHRWRPVKGVSSSQKMEKV